jgi:multisubunit Na+/H+ antiporter MnhF subunit
MGSVSRCLRGAIISPEFLIFVAVVYLVLNPPSVVDRLAAVVAGGPAAVKYIALLPSCIFVWCIAEAKSILLPSEDTKALLQRWPRFPDLKARVITGLIYQAIFAIGAFVAWIYSPTLNIPLAFVLAIMGVFGSVVGASTLFLASVAVRAITKRACT